MLAPLKRLLRARERDEPRPTIVDLTPAEGIVYAVGDVHGCLRQLRAVESQIFASEPAGTPVTIVHLGDMIDRGPDSAGVIDNMLAAPPAGFQRICLSGNHEVAMLKALRSARAAERWLENGGLETLRSYGIAARAGPTLASLDLDALMLEARATVSPAHIAFLRGLPAIATFGPYVFVHAGIRAGVPLERQKLADLLEMRHTAGEFDPGEPPRQIVVHGHTPTRDAEEQGSSIALDTGCYATGRLSALRIEGEERRFLSLAN